MDLTESSETSTKHNLTPRKYPKEHIQDSEHGENLKSRTTQFVIIVIIIIIIIIIIKGWRVLSLRIEDRPPIWRVAMNKLSKQPRTAD
jgi:hypothetical protein